MGGAAKKAGAEESYVWVWVTLVVLALCAVIAFGGLSAEDEFEATHAEARRLLTAIEENGGVAWTVVLVGDVDAGYAENAFGKTSEWVEPDGSPLRGSWTLGGTKIIFATPVPTATPGPGVDGEEAW